MGKNLWYPLKGRCMGPGADLASLAKSYIAVTVENQSSGEQFVA
jgi:hypothetical protein